MSLSNVPALTIDAAGVAMPTEADILAGVLADLNAAFGGNLNTALDTPQGQWASSLTAIIGDRNAQMALLAAMIDPDTASGAFQDAIGRLALIERNPATATVVECLCTGTTGTVIPAGALVSDASGNQYASAAAATIVPGGVAVSFECTTPGAVLCPAGAVTQIDTLTAGWAAVSNPLAGVTGADAESRVAFELRRRASLQRNSRGSVQAIYAAVAAVAGVTDVAIAENPRGVTLPYGATGYPLSAHSVCVSVVGGVDQAVGAAIWSKKDLGCGLSGNTTVTVEDASLGGTGPDYEIVFLRPDPVDLRVQVQVASAPGLPIDLAGQVRAAVIRAFNGLDGGSRAHIGGTVLASRFFSGIVSISPNIQIVSVRVGLGAGLGDSVQLGIDQVPVLSAANIAVGVV